MEGEGGGDAEGVEEGCHDLGVVFEGDEGFAFLLRGCVDGCAGGVAGGEGCVCHGCVVGGELSLVVLM